MQEEEEEKEAGPEVTAPTAKEGASGVCGRWAARRAVAGSGGGGRLQRAGTGGGSGGGGGGDAATRPGAAGLAWARTSQLRTL